VRFFKISELEELIAKENFQMADTERLNLKQLWFDFVVPKKTQLFYRKLNVKCYYLQKIR